MTPAPHPFESLEDALLGVAVDPPSSLLELLVGGESGPGARPLAREWVTPIRDRALQQDVAFFFKQWGGVNKKKAGRTLDGRTWDALPCLSYDASAK